MRIVYGFLFIFFLLPLVGYGQSYKDLKSEGDALFSDGFYGLAVERYEECFRENPTDYEMDYHLGVSYFLLNRLYEAETVLTTVYLHRKDEYPYSIYYLGYLYQRKLDFRKAVAFYKEFYQKNVRGDYKEMVKVRLRNCESGMIIEKQKGLGVISPFPEPINSIDNDFHPIYSPNLQSDKLYFSSNRLGVLGGLRSNKGKVDTKHGHRNADMFVATTVSINVERMSGLLNTSLFDEIIGFSPDGAKMYYKKGYTADAGLLYVDGYSSTSSERLAGRLLDVPFDMQKGDATPYFFLDSLVFFASRRLEGFGGYDLFYASKTADGWSEPINMGPGINSAYDERFPFLTNNQKSIYYSSNRPTGIGGDDVYKSTYSSILKRWNKGDNLGIPINSADDDQYFQMASDGWHFILSSNRYESIGKYDLFSGQFFEQQADQVVMAMNVESEETSHVGKKIAQTILFQKYALETVIPDSLQFVELRLLAKILNDNPGTELVLKVTKTTQNVKGYTTNLVAFSSVIFSFLKDYAPHANIQLRQQILSPQRSKIPGVYVEGLLLRENDLEISVNSIGEVDKYRFVPRIAKGLRYKVEISLNAKNRDEFLALNKYDLSFDVDAVTGSIRLMYGSFYTAETARQWAEQLAQKQNIDVIKIVPHVAGQVVSRLTYPSLVLAYPELHQFFKE